MSEENFEQDLSDFESNLPDRELKVAFCDLTKTKKCLAGFLSGSASSPKEATAVAMTEEKTALRTEEALNDLMLRFAHFLTTEEYEDGNSSSTL